MSFCQRRAVVGGPTGMPLGFDEKPKPGSEFTTTSNASSAAPPKRAGSVSGPIASRNSNTEPGQPWDKIRGTGFDPRHELRIAVEVGFRLAPIKRGGPILDQRLHIIPVNAVAPVIAIQPVRQASFANAAQNALDGGIWYGYTKRTGTRSSCLGQQGRGNRKRCNERTPRSFLRGLRLHFSTSRRRRAAALRRERHLPMNQGTAFGHSLTSGLSRSPGGFRLSTGSPPR